VALLAVGFHLFLVVIDRVALLRVLLAAPSMSTKANTVINERHRRPINVPMDSVPKYGYSDV
jgi:hypothetical protein